jgi:hypothetical protein
VDSLSNETTRNNSMTSESGFGEQRGAGETGVRRERRLRRRVSYLVLPNATDPYLLARVRWPDVFQAISPVRPYWQDDPGLFDLPYAPTSTAVTYEEAARIATEWGARLPSEEEDQASGPSLIRRMPSDWTNLSMAEKRAWSIVVGKSRKARRWGRRRVENGSVELTAEDAVALSQAPAVIDLTDARTSHAKASELS